MSHTYIPLSIQRKIWEESGNRCSNPGCETSFFERQLDLHHIIPEEEGGPTTSDNLILLCEVCHSHFHRGNIGRSTINKWKTLSANKKHNTFLSAGYSTFLYKNLSQLRKQGRSGRVLSLCLPILNATDDPKVIVELGLHYSANLHCMGKSIEAMHVIDRVTSIINNANSNIIGIAKRTTQKLIIEARVKKSFGDLPSSLIALETAKEIAMSEKYVGWQIDYYRACLDILSISNLQMTPSQETFEHSKELLALLIPLLKSKSKGLELADIVVLIAEAQYHQSPFLASQGRFQEIDACFDSSIDRLTRGRIRRGISLRLINWANAKLLHAAMVPSKRTYLHENALDLLKRSIRIATINGQLTPSSTSVAEAIHNSIIKINIIGSGINPFETEITNVGKLLKA